MALARSKSNDWLAALESEVSQGRLVFARQHIALMEQLRAFPLAKHDDGPDALEMAVETSTNTHQWSLSHFDDRVYYDSSNGGPPLDRYS